MLLIADGYYSQMFNEEGRIVLLNQDSQSLYLPTQEVEYFLEVLWAYELLGQD
jgi:hypothetical protein